MIEYIKIGVKVGGQVIDLSPEEYAELADEMQANVSRVTELATMVSKTDVDISLPTEVENIHTDGGGRIMSVDESIALGTSIANPGGDTY